MSDLEEQLLTLDAQLEAAQKIGKAVVSAIGRSRATVKVGRISDIPKGLSSISQSVAELQATAAGLATGWNFDAAAYMEDGRYLTDLKAAAAEQSLSLFEKDGRIYCFPLLLRIDAKQTAVKLGKTVERRIRPSEVARLLAAMQKRPQRFREERFLRILYHAWQRLGGGVSGNHSSPVVALADIHDTLTLLPEIDYPIEEFARDLLLLDRRPDLRTNDGCRFEFPAATLSKGRTKQVIVYDEQGVQRIYIGIRFLKEN